LSANPDDTIVLKVGGTPHMHVMKCREAHGAAAVWGAIMDTVKAENEEDHKEGQDAPEWQAILDSADVLRSMTESLLGRSG